MGGKTTALKSFGCAALMARAGLRVPVESETLADSQTVAARPLATVPFYSLVLADVGDGQVCPVETGLYRYRNMLFELAGQSPKKK
mmetsp:Transcript_37414/g.93077  ORF Transcript_37414/g.93077 Transcript_37414/m.93077 type:complete len:86 (+) Transcript_37414:721-978(+)